MIGYGFSKELDMARRFLFSEKFQYKREDEEMIHIKIGKMRDLVYMVSFMFMAIVLTSCATMGYHKYVMKGSILEASADNVYLCVGTKDGAKVDQELDVYRFTRVATARPTFQRVLVGKVKITEIVDEHMANAKVISGTAEKGDVVELLTP